MAIVYDFDRTLSTSEMQDSFIKSLGMEPKEFWKENDEFSKENGMDKNLAYMFLMKNKSMKQDKPFNRDILEKLGSDIKFYKGVETWFDSISEFALQHGVIVEHYVISSGLKEIIKGTSIANKFKEIFASEYYYDQNGNPVWLKNLVNFTTKTQFLFRINKGALDISDDKAVNEFSYHDERRIPFENMIYIGDGTTDIPCMKIVKEYGGYSIGVYDSSKRTVKELMYYDRVTHYCKADYSENSELFNLISKIIQKVSFDSPLREQSRKMYKESEKQMKSNSDK